MATLATRLGLSSFSEMLTTSRQKRENFYGYLFLTPWLLGFFGLFIGPGLFSLYLSFTKYDVLSPPEWIGLANYTKMFSDDPLFFTSLGRTFYYAGVGVPLGVIGSMFLAILLNAKLRGLAAYRTLFFMPSPRAHRCLGSPLEMAAARRLRHRQSILGRPRLVRSAAAGLETVAGQSRR